MPTRSIAPACIAVRGPRVAVAGLLGLIVAACAPAPTPPVGDVLERVGAGTAAPLVTDVGALEARLTDAGVPLEFVAEQVFEWFAQPGRVYAIGQDNLFVHAYPDAATAAREAARVGADGQTIAREGTGPIKVKWLGAPHLYLSGPLLVVYVGEQGAIMHALTLALGPQFAGPVPPPGVGVR